MNCEERFSYRYVVNSTQQLHHLGQSLWRLNKITVSEWTS
jgi:hypothetical protein